MENGERGVFKAKFPSAYSIICGIHCDTERNIYGNGVLSGFPVVRSSGLIDYVTF